MGDPLTFLEYNCRAWDYLRNWLALRAPSESAIDFSKLGTGDQTAFSDAACQLIADTIELHGHTLLPAYRKAFRDDVEFWRNANGCFDVSNVIDSTGKQLVALEIPADLAERIEAGDKDFDWSAYIVGLIKEVTTVSTPEDEEAGIIGFTDA